MWMSNILENYRLVWIRKLIGKIVNTSILLIEYYTLFLIMDFGMLQYSNITQQWRTYEYGNLMCQPACWNNNPLVIMYCLTWYKIQYITKKKDIHAQRKGGDEAKGTNQFKYSNFILKCFNMKSIVQALWECHSCIILLLDCCLIIDILITI